MSARQTLQPAAVNKRQRISALPITDSARFRRSVEPAEGASPTIPRLAYKVAQAAVALGIDRGAVYDLIKAGRLRYQRLAGGTIIIPKSALDEFLNDAA